MKIENEKIIQATEDELYSYWLSRGWDDVYAFPEYMQRMKDAGCEVIAEIPPPTLFDRITADEETLAEKLVYCIAKSWGDLYWMSTVTGEKKFPSCKKAIAATVAKLKEVER